MVIARRRELATGAAIAALGALSTAAWLAEVTFFKGWEGLRWLEGYPKAAVFGISAVATSAVLAIRLVCKAARFRLMLFGVAVGAVGWSSFELARRSLYELHSRSAGFLSLAGDAGLARILVMKNLACLAGSALLASGGLAAATRLLVGRRRWWWLFCRYLVAIGLIFPLSSLTIRVLPALNGATDSMHVIKMGYPLFWANVLVGVVSWVGAGGRFASGGAGQGGSEDGV